MITYVSTMETPTGPFTMLGDAEGSVLAAGWTADVRALLPLVHRSLRSDPRTRADLGPATKAVRAYLDGDVAAPAAVPVRQLADGTFMATAWAALRKVEPGEPVSYAELAALAGNPAAIRAAAQACARNAAALFVPCHRVMRADGRLGGYRWGTEVKGWLLAHESKT